MNYELILGAVEFAISEMALGRPIVIVSGAPGNEVAEVVIAGAAAEPEWTAWAVRHTSGFLCAAMREQRAEQLGLPTMIRSEHQSASAPMFGVSVDAATGVGTGISATDRAHTARVLADPMTRPEDLSRPGHVMPIRAATHGVLQRRGNAEAAVDLCEIAGLAPVGLTATLVGDEGQLLQGRALSSFAERHHRPVLSVDDLVHYRLHHGSGRSGRLRQISEQPIGLGGARVGRTVDFEDELTGALHTVLVRPSPIAQADLPVYVVFACVHDGFYDAHCGCREQTVTYQNRVSDQGGILIYLRRNLNTVEYSSVDDDELVRACITDILRRFNVTESRIAVWPNGNDQGEPVLIGPPPSAAATHRLVSTRAG